MVDRPGKKGVVLLTDAATGSDPALWPALDAGRPQVFALKLTSEGALSSRPEAARTLARASAHQSCSEEGTR